jgi:hypothetical protein
LPAVIHAAMRLCVPFGLIGVKVNLMTGCGNQDFPDRHRIKKRCDPTVNPMGRKRDQGIKRRFRVDCNNQERQAIPLSSRRLGRRGSTLLSRS